MEKMTLAERNEEIKKSNRCGALQDYLMQSCDADFSLIEGVVWGEDRESYLWMADPDELEGIISALADHYHDGHYTAMKFTTGYKAVFGTPDIAFADRERIYSMETFKTLREAFISAILRQLKDLEKDVQK